ncbi:hypothetical protein H0H81_010835 [Sphagnurus paluster]|uniref:Uncharacterized protein n=1 Tax=Sphagnurus paluster TaxID=117069 RepID=A0A9P7GSH8_9AGAR|nr:hypothetical protein H0H81_010835 [Sphagnurus paluster]
MLWCFPTPKLGLSSQRNRKAAKHSMHIQHNEDNDDAVTESGIFYLVPNRYGTGKTLVRRPRPPPSSAPLDDDFDATTTTRGARTDWAPATPRTALATPHPVSPAPLPASPRRAVVASPHAQQLRRTLSPASTSKAMPTLPPRRPEPPVRTTVTTTTTTTPTQVNPKNSGSADAFELYGEYGHYMSVLDQQLDSVQELTPNPPLRNRPMPKPPAPGPPIVATGRGQLQTQVGGSRAVEIGMPARLAPRGGGQGLRPRQSFEIVGRRVLEDGPERTVTISTWREQVAAEADERANIDVYYLDARDYSLDGVEMTRTERQGGGGEDDADVDSDDEGEDATSASVVEPEVKRGTRKLPPRPPPHEESSPGTIRTITDEESVHASEQRNTMTDNSLGLSQRRRPSGSGSSGWNRSPRVLTRDTRSTDTGDLHQRNMNHSSRPAPGNSTPLSPPRSSTPLRSVERDRSGQTPLRSSTPNRTGHLGDDTAPPFHPTQSGSTISTIQSASVIAFENILAACEPPLLHLSPALARLGIVNEGHLRAIAKLSEETRDRELREEALRQGVTVMEWAILLDKLQKL